MIFDKGRGITVILQGLNLGSAVNASGGRNFFGTFDQYWHGRFADWLNSTFQSKTSTLAERMDPARKRGNMPIDSRTLRPKEWKPTCIKAYPRRHLTLNAVGLSGPGFPALLDRGEWQQRTQPFLISVAAESEDPAGITAELDELSETLLAQKHGFRAPFVLVLNVTCPNLGTHSQAKVMVQAYAGLESLEAVRVPILLNLSVLVTPAAAAGIADHGACYGFCLTNTIPFGRLPERIDWEGLFGSVTSPLHAFGGGGLSGPPLLPLVEEWLKDFRANHSETFPIIAGGGVFSVEDALRLLRAGADAISLGTVAMYHPFRVQPIIQAVNQFCLVRDRREQNT
ncbi:MAG: hypothetical protein HYS45_01925 [Parcubacteria group bacterium]|nr:hypothetical protein [Parcubacteria group bacterium]